ncbi:uncharacterized protein LY89DRAFT_742634 [Mollisia scopiformis]|uniref:SprT-like domain-containing protein n=1 Tax=Mollisia scopiformis TaxID=149040 RepID=A0A132B6J2_MOLSC|nr:uncharacterized protein LY89DRAFT_742634 [Mollisia scopiformis]KUJ07873.1 hypothetical protein LY89DRAFT_742634 [Mollisia scopiformis]
MPYTNLGQLHAHEQSSSDLISRVTAAATFSNGITSVQMSGIERFGKVINEVSGKVASEQLVEKFFHLFDDIFFNRSLRYGVTPKLERKSLPINTCCRGLAPGGKLIVQIGDSLTTSKVTLLGRLLHDMIHAYLWRYAHRSFTDDKLFENGWGFSGHGKAWQDMALVVEDFTKQYLLPLDLGRNEALLMELEQFAEGLNALKASPAGVNKLENEIAKEQLESEVLGASGKAVSKSKMPTTEERSRNMRRSSPMRRRTNRLTKQIPAHIEKARAQKLSQQTLPLSGHDLEVREILKQTADDCIGVLKALKVEAV